MLVWLARRQCPRIDPETCWRVSPLVDELLAAAWPGGPTWHLNLLTLDVPVPIVSAALIDPGPLPLTSFGIAADPSPAHALLLALEEATLTRVMVNRSREATEPPEYDATGVRTLRDHLFAHATSPALRESLRFMSDEGPLVTFGELTERQWAETDEAVTEHLLGLGFEPVSIDVTTDDVAALGFRVVRTAIGGMQPLDNDHSHRYLGGQRLRRPPPGLGFSNDVGESPNPDPHPFP